MLQISIGDDDHLPSSGQQADEPACWPHFYIKYTFVLGIHAREWVAPATAMYFIHKLVNPDNAADLDGVDYYILPLVNPDGYEFSRIKVSSEFKGFLTFTKNISFASLRISRLVIVTYNSTFHLDNVFFNDF